MGSFSLLAEHVFSLQMNPNPFCLSLLLKIKIQKYQHPRKVRGNTPLGKGETSTNHQFFGGFGAEKSKCQS